MDRSAAVLGFLAGSGAGRAVPAVEEDISAGSDVLQWELRERQERQAQAVGAADVLGTGEELPLFLPTTAFMASAGEDQGTGCAFLLFLPLRFPL